MSVYRAAASLMLVFCAHAIGQTSFWTSSSMPGTAEANDAGSVTLGLKFTSDVPGVVTGVRFFKGLRNTGTHVGHLWSSTGTKLAEVTFANETASGWQQASFSTPVAIIANTTYVVSYIAPNGRYAADQYYSWSTVSSSPLRVVGSSPSVFAYGSTGLFPTGTWRNTNYWVDVVFEATTTSSPSTTTSETFWNSSSKPGVPEVTDSATVTLGLKFSSDVAGSVTGVRFYKGLGNTGTHIGQLWSATGAKLAQVTFSNETASGWQQANFSPPVPIAANTPYVISYVAPNGRYAADRYYSWSMLSAPPLRVSGSSPGVFAYSGGTVFPSSTWNGSNYWVDVVFVPQSSTAPTPQTYSISGRISGSAATVTLSGAASKSTTTDSLGNFTFSGLANGSYVVTPSQSGYTFSPASASVSVNNASVSGISFTAAASSSTTTYSISGTVSGSGATVVTLSGTSGGTTTTDSLGNYRFTGLTNGNYVVAPSKSGYAFTPSTAAVSINGASRTGVNFTATVSVSRSVTLKWVASTTPGVLGYNVYRGTTSGGPYTKITGSLATGISYIDNNVSGGKTYYYVATSVDGNNVESSYSSQATAVVPAP